ncbi:MAG: winged helix-turn-helix domain-containing protein [Candidatus Kariarchaeaceae archaeon]|jgi:DNA-binding transcriptional ArsR family regulator
MSEEKKDKIEDELSRIKEEMQELKDILKSKSSDKDDIDWDNEDDGSPPEFNFKIDSNFDDLDIDRDRIDSTLNNYLASVMSGVSDNIRRSMEKATRGIQRMEHDIARKAKRTAERELRRTRKEMRHSMKRMDKHSRKSHKFNRDHYDRNKVIHLNKLNEDELEEFYEIGTKMVSALSDPRRIKLLKLLENGPSYQGDLSEQTGVKGGTFKHHMDSLLDAKYVYQEATRGRYLITQLGVEALKLAEMLYRRYKFEERDVTLDEIPDEEDPVEVDVKYEVADEVVEPEQKLEESDSTEEFTELGDDE